MRQYVGARYVPMIFQNPDNGTNNWKQGTAYEPLTIVSYAGASYTSKRYVPASIGIPSSNPDYWVAIGLYSGQTSANTTAIHKIKESLKNAMEETNTASQAYAVGDFLWHNGLLCKVISPIAVGDTLALDTNIELKQMLPITRDELSGVFPITLSDLSIPEDYARKSYFKNKRVMIIGDSISDEEVLPPNWVTRLREFTSEVNCTIINKSIGGIGAFGTNGMASKVANFTETDIDIIIIELGTNDCNSQAPIGTANSGDINTFIGALNIMHNSIIGKWLNAQIFYLVPPTCSITAESGLIAEQYLPRCMYRYAIQCVCNRYNWNIIDAGCGLPQFDMLTPFVKNAYGDGIHPNATYAPIMMNYIVNQIISGGTTTIGFTSTTYNLSEKGMMDTDNFDNADGQFAFYSSGHFRITLTGTAKADGTLTIVKNIPSQLQAFFPATYTIEGAVVNDVPTNFITLIDKIQVPRLHTGDRVFVDYESWLPGEQMIASTAVSR